ncbi:hypothetical protein K0T92_14490 [Paenibacillus oenotherae]|uniref:Phage tail assembly protein n=1 Tax=Paenibacillus oenotherae TaxID=1435645 RepID=A0ABS7D7U4_9BACL|nr:hypothetical protein [Paenibacillus oenotherae]MBW7475951.1 hypothetical protein [Paenibacillus oenotherae]
MADKNNDVVIINLDRPRVLRYGHKALKTLTALTGRSIDELEGDDGFDMEHIEKFIYCGLLSDARDNGETLKLEQMEDLLDCAPSYQHVIESMQRAFTVAFGPAPEPAGNPQLPVETAAANGTGNKA